MWADYSVGKLLTAADVNAGVNQVCLFIDQDLGTHFYITSTGQRSDAFSTTDKTNIFDFVKVDKGVVLRNSEGSYVCNSNNTLAWSADVRDAAVFTAVQRETGVGNVNGDSSETMGLLVDQSTGLRLNSIDLSGNPSAFVKFNTGPGVWTCFRVFKVDSDEPVVTNVKKFTMNCARGYVYGTGSVLQGSTDASMAGEFALVPYGETTYLYDVTNKKFAIGSADDQSALPTTGDETVTKESATDFSRIITGVAIGETGLQNYPDYLYDKWGNYLNMDGARRVYFNTWQDFENGNGGNTYVVTETGDLDITEAVAMLDAYFNPSTTVKYMVMDPQTDEEFVVATVVANEGDVISDLPEQYKKDFCTYSLAEGPVTLVAGENTVLFDVVYDLPFVTEWGEEADAKWYYAKIRGDYYLNTTVTGTKAGAYYPSATLDESDDSYQWAFKGNPYKGIRIYNKKAGAAQTLGESGDLALMLDGEHTWDVFANGEGFVLRVPGTSNKYVNQNGGSAGYLGYWESTLGRTDAGSTITIEAVPEQGEEEAELVNVVVNMANGTFTQTNNGEVGKQLAKQWAANAEPVVTVTCITGTGNNICANDMWADCPTDGTQLGYFANAAGLNYQITAPSGYYLRKVVIAGHANSNSVVLTSGEESTTFTTDGNTFSKEFTGNVSDFTFNLTRGTSANAFLVSAIEVTVEKLQGATITYIVYDGDNNVLDYTSERVAAGTEVNDIPESMKKAFTNYTADSVPFTVEKDKDAKFEVIVTGYNLPFEVSTEGSEVWYNLKDNGGNYYAHNGGYFYTTDAPGTDTGSQMAFFGNPYVGITVKLGNGSYLVPTGGYYCTADAAQAWEITANGEGFNLHANNVYLAQYQSYLYAWDNGASLANADAGRFFVEAVPAPEAEYTEGEFNVTSLVDGKVLNVDENNLAMVENVVSGEFGCDITSNGNGTFTVGLPGKTASGQHHLHIGSGGNWSNGDATATTFYEVADPAAETLSAKAVESLTLGKTYVLVGVREGANYALSSTLVNAGDASKQRLAGVPATINEGELIMERDATILWTMGHAGEVEETTGLTSGTYLFRNLAGEADKFLGVDVNLSVVDLDALVPTKAVTFSSPEKGVFNLKLGGLAAYLSCGSNGRFSRNTEANAIRLFEIEDVTADPFVATQVTAFKEGHNYLLVGAKSGADYALTAELYNAGQGDTQRMVGTAVTIEEGVISVAKDDKLVWTINEATRPEVVVFEPQPVGEAVDVALYVYANDELVEMTTFEAHVGDVLTDIPEDLKKPFTEYTLAAPFTVGAEDNNLMVDASFNLPFEVDKYYYVKLNGKYMQYDAVRNVGHMGVIDNGDFTYTPMTLEEIEAAEDAKTFHWSISGDPYHHFKLFNEGTQSYLTAAANGYTGVGEEALLVDIAPRGEGLTFTCQYGVLVDFWDTYTAVQENSTGNTDENAVTTLEEVKSEQQGETLQFTIGQDSGTLSGNPGSSWQNYWFSNSEDPKVTFSNASAANLSYGGQTAPYIDIRSGKSLTSPYLVTVSDGYLIMGYHIVGSAMTEAQTITYDGGTYVFESGAGESTLDYTFEEPVTKFNFTLTGPNTGLKGYILLDLKKLVSAPVQYVVNGEDGENWITETLPTEVGTQLTALPETLVRPFTEYSCDKTIVVDAEKENVFTVTAKFTTFQISKEGDEKPFRIKTGTGRYLHANAEGALEAVESEVTPAEDDDTFDFLFFGNPYTGFTIKNANTGTFINVPTITAYSAAANLAEEATVFSVAEQEGGVFQFRTATQAGREAALGDGAQSNGGYQATQVCAWISYLDEEKTSADLTFEANFEEPSDPEKDYVINFDKTQTPTNASRWVSTVSIDDQQIAVSESAADNTLAYRDLREQPGFAVEAGQTVKPAVGYMAEWMHTYAYVDYDRDGQFKVEPTAITDGIIGEGQEIVSFSHYEGYNSAGEAVADGNKTIDMPEFTIPADTKPGYYAMRFKVDWNNVDPAGNPGEGAVGTKQHIITNGGTITDVRLNVHGANVDVKAESVEGGQVTLDDGTPLATAAPVPFGMEFGIFVSPNDGKMLESMTIRHGYGKKEYVHSVRQFAVETVAGTEVVRSRYYVPAEWVDGDITITPVFTDAVGILDINGLNNDEAVYSIDGRRMNQRNILNKGVYVINGKKVLVK